MPSKFERKFERFPLNLFGVVHPGSRTGNNRFHPARLPTNSQFPKKPSQQIHPRLASYRRELD
jgi:hypothetical protein